jgi:hypothetical protein
MCSTKAALSPEKEPSLGPLRSLDALTRSALSEDRQRAKTDSPIRVTGVPSSSDEMAVHLPVPFWPAVSSIFSTR